MLEFRKVQKRIWGSDLSDLEPNGYRASERGIAGHLVPSYFTQPLWLSVGVCLEIPGTQTVIRTSHARAKELTWFGPLWIN